MLRFNLDDFILVKSGKYEIGLSENHIDNLHQNYKKFLYNSIPKHTVTFDNFYFAKHLISYVEFKDFVDETSYKTDAEIEGWGWIWNNKWIKKKDISWKKPFDSSIDKRYIKDGDTCPVLQTSWNDANNYCLWLSKKIEKIVRLPYEKEWEIANKQNEFTSFLSEKSKESFNYENYFNLIDQYTNRKEWEITPSGILWEWTIDWFEKYHGGKENKEFGNTYKVLKGGSLLSANYQKISQYRFRRCPTARSLYYGFRVVVEC